MGNILQQRWSEASFALREGGELILQSTTQLPRATILSNAFVGKMWPGVVAVACLLWPLDCCRRAHFKPRLGWAPLRLLLRRHDISATLTCFGRAVSLVCLVDYTLVYPLLPRLTGTLLGVLLLLLMVQFLCAPRYADMYGILLSRLLFSKGRNLFCLSLM